ncbi:MAG TPA: CARDB domain-containing protein [Gemmatimonadales bacterium]|nr:CARDB domain-containing protein [Gemmatimonadales bacterium]
MSGLQRLLPALLALAMACGGDPSGPSVGSLTVAVSGLPDGTAASVTVSGPGGYSHQVAASETLSGLTPGGYTVAAAVVSSGGFAYRPVQPTQSVTVVEGASPASARVAYGAAGATLTVAVAGLPPGASAAITVTGPNAYSRLLTGTATLADLAAGVYTVRAESVAPAGPPYTPSPGVQALTLAEGGNATAQVSYTQGATAGLDLRIDGMYLTQSVQTYAGAVPLVDGRDGFLRVFVTANQPNAALPEVRVRFYDNGVAVSELAIASPGPSVPLSPDEGSLAASWNIPVPGSLIRPNLSILATVDPANTVAEADETDNAFPMSGSPLAMDVRTASPFSVRFVPIIQSVNGRRGNVSNANKDGYLTAAMRVHPLSAYDADLRAPYTTSQPAVQAENENNAWARILSELDALRLADHNSRYYFGVVNPPYTSGIAGIGYIGGKTAIGWDRPGGDWVAAHEWGHNWGRQHAPCGGPSNPDANYPYPDGSIGIYGLDVAAQSLKPPTSTDLMGYCGNEWISEYTYTGVLAWRSARADVAAGFGQAMQPCLLVWGRIENGQPVLEPAFEVVTRPEMPARGGPYTVDGRARDGSTLFRLSFAAERVADDPRGGQHFAFAIPLPADRAVRLDAIRLAVPGRPSVSVRAAAGATAGAAPEVRTTRAAPGRVALRWDAARHPMVMVRDPATGEVLSFARGGASEVVTDRADLDLQLSSGIGGRTVRVVVPR